MDGLYLARATPCPLRRDVAGGGDGTRTRMRQLMRLPSFQLLITPLRKCSTSVRVAQQPNARTKRERTTPLAGNVQGHPQAMWIHSIVGGLVIGTGRPQRR